MRNLISEHCEHIKASNIRGLFPPADDGSELAKKHAAIFYTNLWVTAIKLRK